MPREQTWCLKLPSQGNCCCCCCWVTSVVSNSVRPHRRQPTRLPHPWDSQARTLEWVAISFANAWKWKVKVKSLSRIRLLATPWTAAHQAPPSMGFSRQEYWSGVPSPSPSKELASFNFKVEITVHSDFGVQENKIYLCFHISPFYLPWSDGTGCHDLSFFECWVLSQLFHSPLSLHQEAL